MSDPVKQLIVDIVTWNSERFLDRLFRTLDTQTSDHFSVMVIDNASSDGTQSWLQEHRPDVSVLRNFRNQGFARAHNQGIALALKRWEEEGDLEHRYIFILNPDIVLDVHCIERLVRTMDAHMEIAIAGPKLYRAIRVKDREETEDEFALSKQIDSTGLVLLKSRKAIDRGAGEEDRGQYDAKEAFGISGAAMVIRASALKTLCAEGQCVFDEDFFAYREDVDLCWRARLYGLKIALISDAIAWHVRTAVDSGSKGIFGLFKNHFSRSSQVVYLSRRNQTWMEWKNDDLINRFIHAPWILWQWLLRLGAFVLFNSHRKGMIDAWKGRSHMKRKRLDVMKHRVKNPEEMREWFT